MSQMIFINLPVADLNKSMDFFKQIGYGFNPQFTNEHGACMIVSDTIFVMLLTHGHYKNFTGKEIINAHQSSEVMIALNAENKEAVNNLVDKAVNAGGHEIRAPQDYGFMYQRSFDDPDGHTWEIFWMDPEHIQ
ncbi:MAG: VOC family protein [Kordiimonadaceae bacterium]|nr:VOC family protein [Kordiimonadaceae bacterium]